MDPLLDQLRIVAGKAQADGTLALVLVVDHLANDPAEPHGIVVTYSDGVATQRGAEGNVAIVDVAFLSDTGADCMAVGDLGEVRIFRGDTVTEEQIPLRDGKIRALQRVGDTFFAVGLMLEAYRRLPSGDWEFFGPTGDLKESFGPGRFESVDGFAPNDLYLAGNSGIIWHYDGRDWSPIDCRTNLFFLSVHCADDGRVYVGGQHGTLAQGIGEGFEIVTSDPDVGHLWGIVHHNGQTYGALDQAIAQLDDENTFGAVPDAMTLGNNFYNLTSAGGKLWSFGMKDVLWFDDTGWNRIDEVDVV